MAELRIVDAGTVTALRSQSLWHGLAAAIEDGEPPVLSFCRPTGPYVSIGYHRSLDELDLPACRRLGLPVLRRRIGGGPVYIDSDQLFFQLTLPAGACAMAVERLYREYLGPAVKAFRALGLDARLSGVNDIAVGETGDRKVSGTGAGQIGNGVTIVGNVMFRFPHDRMASILSLPDEAARAECSRLMRRHVSSLEMEGCQAGPQEAKAALVTAYSTSLGLDPRAATLSAAEAVAIERWDARLGDSEWVAGRPAPYRAGRQIKINAQAWLYLASDGGLKVRATVVNGRLEYTRIESAHLNGAGLRMSRELEGTAADAEGLQRSLRSFGEDGERVARLLVPGMTLQ